MSGYVPQVGDRVRQTQWDVDPMQVVWVGADIVVVCDSTGHELARRISDGGWVKVPTFPERWINVFDGMLNDALWTVLAHALRLGADDEASRSQRTRLGVIHLHADGTLTMEQP